MRRATRLAVAAAPLRVFAAFAAFAALAALSACVFWDAGTWSSAFGRPNDAGAPEAGPSKPAPPLTLASNVPAPWSIAVDSDYLYYASAVNDGGIYQCPLNQSGCVQQETLASNLAGPWYLAVGSASVYWSNSNGGTVQYCEKTVCPTGPYTLASGQAIPEGVALFEGRVYWARGGDPGAILSCPMASPGCPSAGPNVVAGMEAYPVAIAVDATGVYWGTHNPFTHEGYLRFCSPGCQSPETLAAIPGGTESIVLYDGNVYWGTLDDGGAVTSCSESNCAPTPFAPGQFAAQIAVDGTGIYWTESVPNGSVFMCPTTGCGATGPRVLATLDEGTPFAIAIDVSYVYFTDTRNSAVLRIPKPSP
jgi:hypothetical protein